MCNTTSCFFCIDAILNKFLVQSRSDPWYKHFNALRQEYHLLKEQGHKKGLLECNFCHACEYKRKLHSPHISACYEDEENIGYDYDSEEDLFDVWNIDKVTDDVSRLSIDSFNLSQDHISDNHSNIYIAKEEQSRNDFHSHHIVILNTENLEAGNRYDPYGSSSECSSECSYNHKSVNK